MSSIVERLRQHALPDPHDEREVMHAPLLKEAADLIEQQAERIKELEAERDGWREDANVSRNSIAMLKDRCNHFEDTLAALRQRIADAPVVAWLHEVRRDSDVITDQVKHLWGRVPVAVGKEARYTIPLISKEDLQK